MHRPASELYVSSCATDILDNEKGMSEGAKRKRDSDLVASCMELKDKKEEKLTINEAETCGLISRL